MAIKQDKNFKENKDDLAKKIGNKLKELRKSMGLSMKQLAEETKLSPPLFSRIENGLVMPSITTLKMISNIMKVDISYFFRQEEERGYIITHPGSRRIIASKRGRKEKVAYQMELLSEGMENPFMEPAIATLVGKDEDIEPNIHGGQEFMYVLEGRVKMTLGSNTFILKKGDVAYWNGSVPHKGVSQSKKPARTLNVHLIPGRRTGTFQTWDYSRRRFNK